MAIYELGGRTGTATASVPFLDIATTANVGCAIREISLTNTTATALAVGLIRTTAMGTRTSPTALNAGATATIGGSQTTIATAWSGNPTFAAQPHRRWTIGAAIGMGFIWTWGPNEFLIPVSASVCIYLPTGTGQVLDFYVKLDE